MKDTDVKLQEQRVEKDGIMKYAQKEIYIQTLERRGHHLMTKGLQACPMAGFVFFSFMASSEGLKVE